MLEEWKKGWLFSSWHGGVMVKAMVYQGQGGLEPSSWVKSTSKLVTEWKKGLGTCNRFEELNKYLLTDYFEVIQEHFFLGR